jgi:hypothetical protein
MSTRERAQDPEFLKLFQDYLTDVFNSPFEPDERFKMSPEQFTESLRTTVGFDVETITRKAMPRENVSTASQ